MEQDQQSTPDPSTVKLKRREYLKRYLERTENEGGQSCRKCGKQPVLRGFINGGRKR